MRKIGNTPNLDNYRLVGDCNNWLIFVGKKMDSYYQALPVKLVSSIPLTKANLWMFFTEEKGLYPRSKREIYVFHPETFNKITKIIERDFELNKEYLLSVRSTSLHQSPPKNLWWSES